MLQRSLRADVQVEMEFDDDLWPVEVDPGELELAILNICVNSRDAMPEGGTILISARNTRRTLLNSRAHAVTVSIADSGVGMSEDVLSRAFEPFFTTKDVGKGSGLGLAQVYGFLTQSNGQVTIDSEPGKGTTVSLTFPRSDKPPTLAAAVAHALPVAAGKRLERLERSIGQRPAGRGRPDRRGTHGANARKHRLHRPACEIGGRRPRRDIRRPPLSTSCFRTS